MKKALGLFLTLVIVNIFALQSLQASNFIQYAEPSTNVKIKDVVVNIKYPNGDEVSTDAVFSNGRLCLPLEESVNYLNGKVDNVKAIYKINIGESFAFYSVNNTNKVNIIKSNNIDYINIYDLLEPFNYIPIVNLESNTLTILPSLNTNEYTKVIKTGLEKKAFIRLEDITADGLDSSPKYDINMLEKLRYTAEYLNKNNQEYYIAWIPLYANPRNNYYNNLTTNFNLYNAYFLYVLDYMVENGGHLGVHGYSHQYNNDKSADGWEWGDKTPYNNEEQQKRMILAKDTARQLGFKEEFFEFPHYGATAKQLKMAEHYFDVIYQGHPKSITNIYTINDEDKQILYIPTPADYVYFKGDIAILDRLDKSHENNEALSLFYHPVIDKDDIIIQTHNGKRKWYYSGNGNLPKIINKVVDLGYNFSSIN